MCGGLSQSFWLRVRDEFKVSEGKRDSALAAGWNRSDVVLWSLLDRKQTVCVCMGGGGNNWSKRITSYLIRAMFFACRRNKGKGQEGKSGRAVC